LSKVITLEKHLIYISKTEEIHSGIISDTMHTINC